MSVARSSFLFAAGTLFSRVAGLIRDMVVVGVFGASLYLDAFLVAFRIPNLLREMVAEGALGSAFTKVYTSLWEVDQSRARRLLFDSLYLTFLLSALICGAGIIFSPDLVDLMTLMARGERSEEFFFNASGLTRLLFPYLGFTILGSVAMGVLHQRGKFFLSAVSPIFFNLGYIVGALFFADWLDRAGWDWFAQHLADPRIGGLALGVLLGGFLHFFCQFWAVWQDVLRGHSLSLKKLPWSQDVRNVITIMLPATIAASSGPINLFVNTNFATSVGEGAVTWLNYAFRLLQLPIGLFGVAVGVAVLPQLSRSLARAHGKVDEVASLQFQNAVELVLWLMMPCMIFLLANSLPVITLLFQHGRFTEADAVATAAALFAYSFGMIGYALIKVLTSFYYAVERTTFAMKVALFSVTVNLVGNMVFVKIYGHVGLAVTSSLTLSINAMILILGLQRHRLAINISNLFKTLLYLAVGGGLAWAVQHGVLQGLSSLAFEGITAKKVQTGLALTVNGLLTLLVFCLLALLRLQKTPGEALRSLRNIRR